MIGWSTSERSRSPPVVGTPAGATPSLPRGLPPWHGRHNQCDTDRADGQDGKWEPTHSMLLWMACSPPPFPATRVVGSATFHQLQLQCPMIAYRVPEERRDDVPIAELWSGSSIRRFHELVHLCEQPLLAVRSQERCSDRVPAQALHIVLVQTQGRVCGEEVIGDVSPEIRWIVGVHRDQESVIQEPLEIVILDPLEHVELHVGERTDRERDLVGHEPVHQPRVLEAANSVVDPSNMQEIERLPDVLWRSLLSGMGNSQEPFGSGTIEHIDELPRRIANFGRIEPDGYDPISVGQRMFERGHGARRTEMS